MNYQRKAGQHMLQGFLATGWFCYRVVSILALLTDNSLPLCPAWRWKPPITLISLRNSPAFRQLYFPPRVCFNSKTSSILSNFTQDNCSQAGSRTSGTMRTQSPRIVALSLIPWCENPVKFRVRSVLTLTLFVNLVTFASGRQVEYKLDLRGLPSYWGNWFNGNRCEASRSHGSCTGHGQMLQY